MRLALAFAAALVSLAPQAPKEPPSKVPVYTDLCRILAEPTRFDQTLVSVRGRVVMGKEVFLLEDPGCKERLRTGDYMWPPAIWLTPPNVDSHLPTGYELDRGSEARFAEAVKAAIAEPKKWNVLATFTGKIDARHVYLGHRGLSDEWIGSGFGHRGAYVAQLVYMKVSNWEITPVEPDSSEEKKTQTGP